MKELHNISAQQISWVKSNQQLLEEKSVIENLFYPESLEELENLIVSFHSKQEDFVLVGYSSNTLFLPTFRKKNVICTKHVSQWEDKEDYIECDCGVPISRISKYAVEQGYVGFEGLTDLPGTIAASVYGNCGCRGCCVCDLVYSFTLLESDGHVNEKTVADLHLTYRSSSLKRGELKGTILRVKLRKQMGDPKVLKTIAEKNHQIRQQQQPSGQNNLGTTINGGKSPTIKGLILQQIERLIRFITRNKDTRKSYPKLLKLIGHSEFVPYVYYWNRYMFLDEKSHLLFDEYFAFVKSVYKDARLEIEIRK